MSSGAAGGSAGGAGGASAASYANAAGARDAASAAANADKTLKAKPSADAQASKKARAAKYGGKQTGAYGKFDPSRGSRAQADGSGNVPKGKKSGAALYGYQGAGPERAEIPPGGAVKGKGEAVAQRVEEANQDEVTQPSKRKISHRVNNVQTLGSLSHDRVGKVQRMASFGTHRRSANWAQPGVAHKQLLGPFSDHLPFKQRAAQGSSR